jgi:hypothetical protein
MQEKHIPIFVTNIHIGLKENYVLHPVLDLQLCLSTGPRWSGGPSSYQKKTKQKIAMDFFLCGAILNLKSVCPIACVGPPGLPPSGPK